MTSSTGPNKATIHFYLTFLFSIMVLIANNQHMSIPMLWGTMLLVCYLQGSDQAQSERSQTKKKKKKGKETNPISFMGLV